MKAPKVKVKAPKQATAVKSSKAEILRGTRRRREPITAGKRAATGGGAAKPGRKPQGSLTGVKSKVPLSARAGLDDIEGLAEFLGRSPLKDPERGFIRNPQKDKADAKAAKAKEKRADAKRRAEERG